jgi:hypothetical protein
VTMKIIPLSCLRNEDLIPKTAALTSVTLELVSSSIPSATPESGLSQTKLENRCLVALEQSAQRTSNTLAFSGCSLPLFPGNTSEGFLESLPPGLTRDTWLTVSSLLASGLPIPKSPSGELPKLDWSCPTSVTYSRMGDKPASNGRSHWKGHMNPINQQTREKGMAGNVLEREERGWWTLRFQQVLGEMKRQGNTCAVEI